MFPSKAELPPIPKARTGLLDSKHSPVYSALQTVKTSLVKTKARSIVAATQTPPCAQSTDGYDGHHDFKRGDLANYMMSHDDYLDTLDDAFASVELPGCLKPVKAKSRRDGKGEITLK